MDTRPGIVEVETPLGMGFELAEGVEVVVGVVGENVALQLWW